MVVCPISCGQPQTQSLSLSRSFLLSSFLLSHHHLINLLSSSSVFLHHWFAHRYSLFSLLFFILPSLSFFYTLFILFGSLPAPSLPAILRLSPGWFSASLHLDSTSVLLVTVSFVSARVLVVRFIYSIRSGLLRRFEEQRKEKREEPVVVLSYKELIV